MDGFLSIRHVHGMGRLCACVPTPSNNNNKKACCGVKEEGLESERRGRGREGESSLPLHKKKGKNQKGTMRTVYYSQYKAKEERRKKEEKQNLKRQ